MTDLEALAADTHDFESRYLDPLVGPWPEAAATYRERSPIHHPDRVVGSGAPAPGRRRPGGPGSTRPTASPTSCDAHGVHCPLTVFAGESHGFRRADTIEACLDAELDFYRALFAPDPGASRRRRLTVA